MTPLNLTFVTSSLAAITSSAIYRANPVVRKVVDEIKARVALINKEDETELAAIVTELQQAVHDVLQIQTRDTCTVQEAMEIMGDNGHTVEQMETHLNAKYTVDQKRFLQTVPFSRATLEKYKDTHILVPGAPISINNTRAACEAHFNPNWTGHKTEDFSQAPMDITWHLLRKTHVDKSAKQSFLDQEKLIKDTLPGEVVALAKNLVPAIMVHYMETLATKGIVAAEKLMTEFYVRCQEVGSDGHRVHIGFHSAGFFVHRNSDDLVSPRVAIASAVEVPNAILPNPNIS